MPEYEFEDEKGKRVTVVMAMADHVRIGDKREFKGKILTRVPSRPAVEAQKDIHYGMISAEPNTPGARKYDSLGTPLISSKQERDNVFAAAKDKGYEWDK